MNERKYPIGIQTFSEMIRKKYVYVDKTDLVWRMANSAKFTFLSRPRRFGKSLLSSTLHSYFAGEKELFEGLKIMPLEQEWAVYPVLHFDLSGTKHGGTQGVVDEIGRLLRRMEADYGITGASGSIGMRFATLIEKAYTQTNRQVVVIIDEYDAPLLDVLHNDQLLAEVREVMQEFYQRLKMCEPMIRFCFITGITKFSQLSIFSTLNNLKNVSMLPEFSAICGITESELCHDLRPDMELLAEAEGCTVEETHRQLKELYDGYHFSRNSEETYNPFSLINAFSSRETRPYWFDTGTPTFLIRQMQYFHTDITQMEDIEVPATAFDRPTEAMTDALPLLYQSGYLTIKDYDRIGQVYTLAIPNQEVRIGFTEGLLPTYVGIDSAKVQVGFALKFWRALKQRDIDRAMREMQAYLAGIPYVEGFKKKLAEAATAEGFYEYTFYLIFNMLNVYARTQVKCFTGRIDMVVHMPNNTYVFELKTSASSGAALRQIDDRGNALPYQTGSDDVVKVGVSIDTATMTLKEWVILTC